MGLITLGLFAANDLGFDGAVLQMVNHGLISATLFLLAGAIERRTATGEFLLLGGMARGRPALATLLMTTGVIALAVPGSSAFAGEFLVLAGVFQQHWVYGVVGAAAIVLAAMYVLRLISAVLHRDVGSAVVGGRARPAAGRAGDPRAARRRAARAVGVAGRISEHSFPNDQAKRSLAQTRRGTGRRPGIRRRARERDRLAGWTLTLESRRGREDPAPHVDWLDPLARAGAARRRRDLPAWSRCSRRARGGAVSAHSSRSPAS